MGTELQSWGTRTGGRERRPRPDDERVSRTDASGEGEHLLARKRIRSGSLIRFRTDFVPEPNRSDDAQ
jgi:hypothetical protein